MIKIPKDVSTSIGEVAVLEALKYMYENNLGVLYIQQTRKYSYLDSCGVDFVVKTSSRVFPMGNRKIYIQVKSAHKVNTFNKKYEGHEIALIKTLGRDRDELVDILRFIFERPPLAVQVGGDREYADFLSKLGLVYSYKKHSNSLKCVYLGKWQLYVRYKDKTVILALDNANFQLPLLELFDESSLNSVTESMFQASRKRTSKLSSVLEEMMEMGFIKTFEFQDSTFVIEPNPFYYPKGESKAHVIAKKASKGSQGYRLKKLGEKVRFISISEKHSINYITAIMHFILERPVPVIEREPEKEYIEFLSLLSTLNNSDKFDYKYLGDGKFTVKSEALGIFTISNLKELTERKKTFSA